MFNVTNIMCGISDSHNIISVAIKGDAPPPKHRKIKYRSFKNFDEDAFSEAVGVAPFEVAYVFDDVDDIYWAHEVLLTDLLNEHAPIKEKRVKSMLFRLPRDCSASGMFAVNNAMSCPALVRKLVFGFYKRVNSSLKIVLFRPFVDPTSGGNLRLDQTGINCYMSTTLAKV